MSATLVQSAPFSSASWSSPLNATAPSNFTAGSTVVVNFTHSGNGTTRVTGVTVGGTAATKVYDTDNGASTLHLEMWIAENVTGGTNAITVTSGAGSAFRINGSADEWTGLKTAPLDAQGETVQAGAVTTITATASGASAQADEVAYFLYGTTNNSPTAITAPAGYTQLWINTANGGGLGGYGGYKILSAIATESATASGFTSSSCFAFIVTLKAGNPTPNITGGTANPVHQSTGNTITGINFGASQGTGTLAIGGQSQTVTAWSATSITYTANRGVNLNDVAVNAVVTTDAGDVSSNYALTGFDPPSGYSYVTLGTPDATAAHRITAVGDIASGNQLEWDNSLVTINDDGSFVADPSVSSFYVRVGVTTDGWGALALQSINGSSSVSGFSGVPVRRAFNKRSGLGF